MTISQLRNVLYKHAAEDQDPAAAAMAGAAAVAKPSWAPAMPDFTKKKEEDGSDAPDLSKELEKRQKEIDQLKNEKRIIEQNLQFEQIKSKQNEASRKLEQQERQSLEKIRQEQQKLDQKRIMDQAEEVKHQSVLSKQESDSQLRIQQDKNKSLMDLHNQQLKMQMSQNDQLLKQKMQHADQQLKMQQSAVDKARATADKYKDDARKQIDKERLEMHKAYQKQHSGLSPALNNTMTGAIKALSQFGKPQKVKLPKPGASPDVMSLLNPKANMQESIATAQDTMQNKQASLNLRERIDRIVNIPSTRGCILKHANDVTVLPEVKQKGNPTALNGLGTPQPVSTPKAPEVPKPTPKPTPKAPVAQPEAQAPATQPEAPAGTPIQLIQSQQAHASKKPSTVNRDPHQNVAWGQPDMLGMMLSQALGPLFNFNKSVSHYDLVRDDDKTLDAEELVRTYNNGHAASPIIEKLTRRVQPTPGWASLQPALQYNPNYSDNQM